MINIPKRLFVPKVIEALQIDCDILLLYGGRDAGKSTSLAKAIIPHLVNDKHFRGLHARSQYNQIKASTFQNLKDRVRELGWNDIITTTTQNYLLINKLYDNNYLMGGSGDAADSMRSAQDINFIWFEEFHDASQEDFTSIYGTLRKSLLWKSKFVATFNTDRITEDHWIYKSFFCGNEYEGSKVVTVKINSCDNPFIDQEATTAKHRLAALGNEDVFNSIHNGDWAKSDVIGKWIYVDYQHLITTEHLPTIEGNTVYLSFDFNNEPMTCTAWQFSSGHHAMTGEGHFIRCVAEFEVSMSETDEEIIQLLCKKIKAVFPYHPLRVTGDANGRHRLKGVAGQKSIFTLIAGYLGISEHQIDVPKADMELIPSRALCNTFMFNHKNVQLSTANTPMMIKDIKNAKANPAIDNPKLQDQIIKDRQANKNDYFDTFRYIIHTYFNYFLRN